MSLETSAAVIITRPPEIVTCIRFLISGETIFLIFDSHPRPSHPGGAAFILCRSIGVTAAHLNSLLAVDSHFLTDSHMQWQAQLLAQYSGHVFVFKPNDSPLSHSDLETSLATLDMRAEISDLKSRTSDLVTENKRLKAEALTMQAEISNLTYWNTSLAVTNDSLRAEVLELRLRDPVRTVGRGKLVRAERDEEMKNLRSVTAERKNPDPQRSSHPMDNDIEHSSSNNARPVIKSSSSVVPNHTLEAHSIDLHGQRNVDTQSINNLVLTDEHPVLLENKPSSQNQGAAANKQREFDHDDGHQLVTQQPPNAVLQKPLPAEPNSNAAAGPSQSGESYVARVSSDSSTIKQRQDHTLSSTASLDPPPYDFVSMSHDSKTFSAETQPTGSHGLSHPAQAQLANTPPGKRIFQGFRNLFTSRRRNSTLSVPVAPEPQSHDWQCAALIQREFDEEDRRLRAERQQLRKSQRQVGQPTFKDSGTKILPISPSHLKHSVHVPPSELDDFERAVQIQLELDEEERLIREEHWQDTFDCGICLETYPEDDVARMETCMHVFCRECMRRHICSKLKEHRFPIFCPTCSTGKSSSQPASKIPPT